MRHPDTKDEIFSDLWTTLKIGENWEGEVKNKKKDGGYFWASVVISPRYDAINTLSGYTAIRQDITNEKLIQGMAITDQLTNIYNRRYFNEVFPREIKRSIRTGYRLSFMMLDIDFFKQYNDTYGHQAGDEALKKVAKALKNQLLRVEDLVFRLGGEEFGIIYSTTSCTDSSKIAKDLCKAIFNLKIEHKSSQVASVLSVSIGLVCIEFSKSANTNLDMNTIYKLADDELYKAKDSGRNRVSYKYFKT
jgi:diguanylate cyclase (GGDEF)-like protein